MPTIPDQWLYRCEACHRQFSTRLGPLGEGPQACPLCGAGHEAVRSLRAYFGDEAHALRTPADVRPGLSLRAARPLVPLDPGRDLEAAACRYATQQILAGCDDLPVITVARIVSGAVGALASGGFLRPPDAAADAPAAEVDGPDAAERMTAAIVGLLDEWGPSRTREDRRAVAAAVLARVSLGPAL